MPWPCPGPPIQSTTVPVSAPSARKRAECAGPRWESPRRHGAVASTAGQARSRRLRPRAEVQGRLGNAWEGPPFGLGPSGSWRDRSEYDRAPRHYGRARRGHGRGQCAAAAARGHGEHRRSGRPCSGTLKALARACTPLPPSGRWDCEAPAWGALEDSSGAAAAVRVWWRVWVGQRQLGPMDGSQGARRASGCALADGDRAGTTCP